MHADSTHLWLKELDLARLGDNRYNLRGRPRLEINEGTSSSGVAIKAFLARLVKLIIFWAVIHNSALFASYWSNLRTDL